MAVDLARFFDVLANPFLQRQQSHHPQAPSLTRRPDQTKVAQPGPACST